ncbi:MAG: glycoside hydrolase family 3 C-terminal domain-containing protein [Clostridia bacterium]|nr:glycoside hydrolase family 3 C-terminal domain-containing protein [Clostridia bacterium]
MYKNAKLSPEERAKDLLGRMTLDEKIDQMAFFPNLAAVAGDAAKGEDLPQRCGAFGNLGNLEDPEALNKMQDYFLNKTRLGIPLIMAFESLHGFYHPKATAFPQCAGLGGSFNPSLIYEMAKIIGREARAVGVRQLFAPNIDIPRDPRWGRSQEAYGEDPYLVAEMGEQYVKGVQEEGVAATAKHFIAYGVPEGGINLTPAHVGEREIREVMLEPFQRCIDAGVKSIMPSYNEVDGEPVHASRKLLKDILSDEMGFDGTLISDWGAIHMLHDFQYVAKDFLEAGKMALSAGIDIEAPEPKGYGEAFRAAAKNGDIDVSLIDRAVLKILKLKFELGLFENPYATGEEMNTAAAKELALKLDEQSILLLENDGMLPLDENKVGRVAVIGNNAKHSFMGDYIAETADYVDFYSGIKNRLGEDRVLYARGCGHLSYTDEMIAEAVETARKADTVMLVLGDSTDGGGGVGGGGFKDNEITCGEGYDTHTLDFPPSQKKLFDAIIALGKPTLLVLYAGRPFTIKEEVKKVNAFMFSWGGGEQSGNAFANLIFGDKTPSAKLSFSMPQSTGHIPCYYNYKKSARGSFYKRPGAPGAPGRDYVSASPAAWYPFGYGLSYTTLKYSGLEAKVTDGGKVHVSVCVENKGNFEIDESVLLFVRMMYCPTTPFIKKLRKFSKVNLRPGERKTVEFTLSDEDFTYIDENMKTAKNRGEHKIMIADLECTVEI